MGNKYWEFKDQLNSRRMRRIVEYGKKVHLSDVKIARKSYVEYLLLLNAE